MSVLKKVTFANKFLRFINVKGLKGIKRDEWESIYYFFKQNPDDLSNYSIDDSWPIIFDEFADWIQSKGG